MTLHELAERRRLPVRRDADQTPTLFGRALGATLVQDGPGFLLSLATTPRAWNAARRALEAAGAEVRQDGDGEGSVRLDPADPAQVRLALRLGRFRPRRRVTPETLARLRENGFRPAQERPFRAQKAPNAPRAA